jgi:dUTP pyrophosphatase
MKGNKMKEQALTVDEARYIKTESGEIFKMKRLVPIVCEGTEDLALIAENMRGEEGIIKSGTPVTTMRCAHFSNSKELSFDLLWEAPRSELDNDFMQPEIATKSSIGIDIKASHDATIAAGEFASIGTGVHWINVRTPPSHLGELQVRGRSGLAKKHGIMAFVGTIDSDYRGEIRVILTNHSPVDYHIEAGDKIAQLVPNFVPYFNTALRLNNERTGGFGSTGK